MITFTEWFLSVMLDQIRFSNAVFQLDKLHERYKDLLVDLKVDKRAIDLIMVIFKLGEMERGDAQYVLKTAERTARKVVAHATHLGFLKSHTPKGPLRIGFPLQYRERFFPNLFTDGKIDAPYAPTLTFGR